jgi:hypothetical protein
VEFMTREINAYAATLLPLVGATVLTLLAVLVTSGGVRVVAFAVLILLIMVIAALAGLEIARQRRAELEK